ncbi:MAG: hypothetical protein GQ527_06645 [Bacteroidales bacterium]|nr:hypothetical protein [Bacteroidales bacterium]
MKKLSYLFMIGMMVIAGSFTSCQEIADELEDAVEVTINTELSVPFVAVPDASKGASFKVSEVLDPANNEDLADYLEKIQSVEITNITVNVTSVSSSDLILESAVFNLTDNVNGSEFRFSIPNNSAVAEGSVFEVGADNPDWDTINEIISAMHASTVEAVGTFNLDEFEVGFEYVVSVRVVAKM